MALSSQSTPAKLIHGGLSTDTSVGAGTVSAATNAPDPDSDAREAVEAMLKETGSDRATIEGPAAGLKDSPPQPSQKDDLLPDGTKKPAAAPDDKTTPAADDKTTAPAAGAPSDADLDINLTAEDLAEIEKQPLLKKAYKVMVRGLNKKLEDIANKRKGVEADLDVIDRVKKSPVAGLQALAAVLGVPIQIGQAGAPPVAGDQAVASSSPVDPVAAVMQKFDQVLTPDGAKALTPLIVELIQAVTGKELTKELGPIKSDLAGSRQVQVMSQLDNALLNYGRTREAGGDDWSEEIQTGMAELVGKIRPGDGTTLNEFLDVLYDRVTGQRSREAVRNRQLQRLRQATAATEPVHAARPAPVTVKEITSDMSDDEATDLAVAQTMKELGLR